MRAIGHTVAKDSALDLGAGGLRDTRALLDAGFSEVVAFDSVFASRAIESPRLSYVEADVEEYIFESDKFDLVNAHYVLPFVSAHGFPSVWERLHCSLKMGAIYTGQLFGNRDSWASTLITTTFEKSEVEKLLSTGFDVLEYRGEEYDGPSNSEANKHWHVFNFLLRNTRAG